jgi:prepilin-type N-terminal cleavage/methylation domain-containing protein/prepilin-type processing-associated H-X9-DG protein
LQELATMLWRGFAPPSALRAVVRRRPRGFTLLELLVALAIVGVLVALMGSSLGNAYGVADSVRCQSTLRQWALAMRTYALQNNGALPRRGQGAQPTAIVNRPEDWFNALPKVMGMPPYSDLAAQGCIPRPGDASIWMCPAARQADTGTPCYFAYGMNMLLSTWLTGKPDYLDAVPSSATQVFMADGPGAYCSVLPSSRAYSPVARHNGMVNISFLDGHVASFPGDYVGCGKGDPHQPEIRWTVPGSPWRGPE